MRFHTERNLSGLVGPWRSPTNIAAHAKGSIHDDDTAQQLGLRGGTVAGSIHMEQYPPLLLETFGERWWKSGNISLFFKEATTHGEAVRCHAGQAESWGEFSRAPIWMEGVNGQRINEGTSSVGPIDQMSTLRRRVLEARPASDLRMLKNARVGDFTYDVPSRITASQVDAHLPVITEPLQEYVTPHAFGGRVVPMNLTIDAFRVIEKSLVVIDGPRVGLYGAIEVQFIDGPVLADRDYVASGRILALSDSPKTEVMWWEAELADARSGALVAKMLHMTRLMKASSPHWI